jgi:hypothetical protein
MFHKLVGVALLIAPAAAQAQAQRPCYGPDPFPDEPVRGHVELRPGGAPVFMADIMLDDSLVARSDCRGDFVIPGAAPGTHSLIVNSARLIPETLAVKVAPAKRQKIHIFMRYVRLPPPSGAVLAGTWALTLTPAPPDTSPLHGRLTVDTACWDPGYCVWALGGFRRRPEGRLTDQHSSRQRHRLAAIAVRADSVVIRIGPLDSHSGLTLIGTSNNGSISGTWCAQGYDTSCASQGTFQMTR